MIRSMTGFATQSAETDTHRIQIEIRAVNHRFLDIQWRMADEWRVLEGALREKVAARVSRGKLDCRLAVSAAVDANVLSLNEALIDRLAETNSALMLEHPRLAPLSVAEILRFPGALLAAPTDQEALTAAIVQLVEATLNDFNAAREREGAKLREHLLERLDKMQHVIDALKTQFPALLQQYQDKLRARLAEAVADPEETRLQQEFALFLQKADVDEEFSRLFTHLDEVRRILEQPEPAGKRLDFLMQELNREANTLGSKAIATACTRASVELKVLIEQMREQVQNIE